MTRSEVEDIKRHFEVVAESLRSDIRLLAEGHDALRASIDGLSSRLDTVHSELDGFRGEMYAFRSEMSAFRSETRSDLQELKERVSVLEGKPN
jgi:hypothetical protein